MSSTVLQIGNAAAQIVGLPRQATLVGNQNQNAVKVLRALENAKREVSRDFDWVALKREHTFATDGSSSYAVPNYFDRIINGTLWDRTNYRSVIGPLSSTEWQKWESGTVSGTTYYKLLRIFSDSVGTKILKIYPSSDSGSTIAFEYIDSRAVIDPGGTLKEDITDDGDTFVFDDEAVEMSTTWRLLRMLGLNYDDEQGEYMRLVGERKANDGGAPVLNLSLDSIYMGFDPHLPDSGFGS